MKRRRHRPLLPAIAPWPAKGYSRHYDALSFGEHARRGSRAWLWCGFDCGHWEVNQIDFAERPWRRYHNYPTGSRFLCPGCGKVMAMRVTDFTVPGTGR
jgi:hypothetical protein